MAGINELLEQMDEGMDVYGSDGQKLGEVGEIHIGTQPGQAVTSTSTADERSYFEVRRGFLGFGNDLWLPGEAIQRVSPDGVTLRYTSDEAAQHAWSTRPSPPEPKRDRDFGLLDVTPDYR